jgi:hypothetical protein
MASGNGHDNASHGELRVEAGHEDHRVGFGKKLPGRGRIGSDRRANPWSVDEAEAQAQELRRHLDVHRCHPELLPLGARLCHKPHQVIHRCLDRERILRASHDRPGSAAVADGGDHRRHGKGAGRQVGTPQDRVDRGQRRRSIADSNSLAQHGRQPGRGGQSVPLCATKNVNPPDANVNTPTRSARPRSTGPAPDLTSGRR